MPLHASSSLTTDDIIIIINIASTLSLEIIKSSSHSRRAGQVNWIWIFFGFPKEEIVTGDRARSMDSDQSSSVCWNKSYGMAVVIRNEDRKKKKMWKIKFFPHLLPFFDVQAATTTGGANRSVTTTSKVQRHKSHATLAPIAGIIISFLFSSLWLARSLCSPASAIKDFPNTKIFQKRKNRKQKTSPPPLGKRSIPIILNTRQVSKQGTEKDSIGFPESFPCNFFLTKTTTRKDAKRGGQQPGITL